MHMCRSLDVRRLIPSALSLEHLCAQHTRVGFCIVRYVEGWLLHCKVCGQANLEVAVLILGKLDLRM